MITEKKLNDWAEKIHKFLKSRNGKSYLESYTEIQEDIHIKLSEASKDFKFKNPLIYQTEGEKIIKIVSPKEEWDIKKKTEGQAIKLMDVSILLLGIAACKKYQVNIEKGIKIKKEGLGIHFQYIIRTFLMVNCIEAKISKEQIDVCISLIICWFKLNKIDFEKTMALKFEYNKRRAIFF